MMVKDFFKAKRPWSEYKDLILGYYLKPYIPKVNTIGKPILIVDCFAGPGKFGDNKPGSPLIICSAIKEWREKGMNVRGVFIEADDKNFAKLRELLDQYSSFSTVKHGTFEQHLPELAALAQQNTVFLYVDPYSVRGLDFEAMRKVYEQIKKAGASVEVLLNLNVPIFMRWALAALKRHGGVVADDVPPEVEDEVFGADEADEPVELTTLNAIAGGDYWQAIAADTSITFAEKVDRFMRQYAAKMGSCFPWVGWYDVKLRYQHQVPKYFLVYATRNNHGVELMNDGMCRARREFLKDQFPPQEGLFGTLDPTPQAEQVDLAKIADQLMKVVPTTPTFTRRALRLNGMKVEDQFCRYGTKDYNEAVAHLIKSGRLYSRTGRPRINDEEALSLKPFATTK